MISEPSFGVQKMVAKGLIRKGFGHFFLFTEVPMKRSTLHRNFVLAIFLIFVVTVIALVTGFPGVIDIGLSPKDGFQFRVEGRPVAVQSHQLAGIFSSEKQD